MGSAQCFDHMHDLRLGLYSRSAPAVRLGGRDRSATLILAYVQAWHASGQRGNQHRLEVFGSCHRVTRLCVLWCGGGFDWTAMVNGLSSAKARHGVQCLDEPGLRLRASQAQPRPGGARLDRGGAMGQQPAASPHLGQTPHRRIPSRPPALAVALSPTQGNHPKKKLARMSHPHSASPYTPSTRPVPLPSPSISPSINSLLNTSAGPPTANPRDYFGQPSQPAQLSANDFFSNDAPQVEPAQVPHRYLSPTGRKPDPPRRTPSGGPVGLSHLLSVDRDDEVTRVNEGGGEVGRGGGGVFESHEVAVAGRTLKRPRTGDSDGSCRSSLTPVPPSVRVLSSDGETEQHNDMPPPARGMSTTTLRPSPTPSNQSSTSTAPPPPPQPAPPAASQPNLPDPHTIEPSIFGIEPLDEFTREVADWIWGFSMNLDPAEVEVSKTTPRRDWFHDVRYVKARLTCAG